MTHDAGADPHGLEQQIADALAETGFSLSPQRVLGVLQSAGVPLRDLAPSDLEACVAVAACVADDASGQRRFEERYIAPAGPALRSLGLDAASADDVLQRVWVKLFVSEAGEQPRIFGYLGKGDLRAFVKVVATRIALSDRRSQRPQAGDAALVDVAGGATPQLQLLAEQDRALLSEAVERAAALLDAEERVLLRMTHVDGLTVDEIGAAYGVHRATAARRVARARARLVHEVRERLKARLGVGTVELESAMRDVDTQVHVSLSRILGS